MDIKMIKLINEIGFDDNEIELLNKVCELNEVPHKAFMSVLMYFIKESYRKGTLNGIDEIQGVIHKNIINGFL